MSQESKYRKFSKEFRESALRRLALAPNVAQLCRELGISRQLLYSLAGNPDSGASNRSNLRTVAQAPAPGECATEEGAGEEDPGSGFFEGCLRKGRGSGPEPLPALAQWHLGSNSGNDAGRKTALVSSRCAGWPQVSRAGFYRFLQHRDPGEEEWKCATRSSRSCLSIAAATVTGASPSNSIAAACRQP